MLDGPCRRSACQDRSSGSAVRQSSSRCAAHSRRAPTQAEINPPLSEKLTRTSLSQTRVHTGRGMHARVCLGHRGGASWVWRAVPHCVRCGVCALSTLSLQLLHSARGTAASVAIYGRNPTRSLSHSVTRTTHTHRISKRPIESRRTRAAAPPTRGQRNAKPRPSTDSAGRTAQHEKAASSHAPRPPRHQTK